MNTKRSSTAQTTDTHSLPRHVTALRIEAIANGLGALVVIVGAVLLAWLLSSPYPLALFVVGAVLVVRSYLLDGYAQRMAEALPPKPQRGPNVWRRLWWWIVRRRLAAAATPKPYRPVRVAGVADAVRVPRQPGEMAREAEPVIVAGLTASDVYWIACRAASIGLDERSWKLSVETVVLPSGRQLSRNGFRSVQAWLVERGLADKYPRYHMTGTPETVLENLK